MNKSLCLYDKGSMFNIKSLNENLENKELDCLFSSLMGNKDIF